MNDIWMIELGYTSCFTAKCLLKLAYLRFVVVIDNAYVAGRFVALAFQAKKEFLNSNVSIGIERT